jgi:wyosine [tRNA(Phe)-imidazoG37] synthetase (radical SAM superfamily)
MESTLYRERGMRFDYVFGPVRSSRLGRSLGLDLLGEKICPMDCLYCEVGRTRIKTLERKPYVPARAVLAELSEWLELGLDRPDHITLGGQGEPTLNSELSLVVAGARALAPSIPLAVLTNSILLGDPDVAEALNRCSVILPSLDSLVEREFRTLNRPLEQVTARKVAEDMLSWRQGYNGKVFLEILLVRGINDSKENLALLTEFSRALQPDRVDVVTMSRPGSSALSRAVDGQTLERWRKAFHAARPEHPAIPSPPLRPTPLDQRTVSDLVESSLRRRPQTLRQLAHALGLEPTQVSRSLETLIQRNAISPIESDGTTFYSLNCSNRN